MRRFASVFIVCSIAYLLISFPAANAAARNAKPHAEQTALNACSQEFSTLIKNAKAGKLRQNWLALEKKLVPLTATKQSAINAQATFLKARVREELALRSHTASDYRVAAEIYGTLAQKFPKHDLAAQSLLKQAEITAKGLKNPQKAKAIYQSLIKKYPRSEAAQKAATLLKQPSAQTQSSQSVQTTAQQPTVSGVNWQLKNSSVIITLPLDKNIAADAITACIEDEGSSDQMLLISIDGVKVKPSIEKKHYIKSKLVPHLTLRQQKNTLDISAAIPGVKYYAVRQTTSAQTVEIEISRKRIRGGQQIARASSGTANSPNAVLDQLGLSIKTIMIDAGHGGKDPGAVSNSITEKKYTLAIAKQLGAALQKKGYTVLYTRTNDKFIPLESRPQAANKEKVDLFISIHINANPDTSVNGLETYYLAAAQTKAAEKVAARENAVAISKVSDLQFILSDLTLNAKLEESQDIARLVQQHILRSLKKGQYTMSDNGVRSAPFYVLMGARMPAILIECGYASNTTDAALLKQDKFITKQVDGIIAGIEAYKQKLAKYAKK